MQTYDLFPPERDGLRADGPAADAADAAVASADACERHYRLAMRAARRIGRARHRDRAGRLICHHLLRMLEVPVARPVSSEAPRPDGERA